jgi:SAM-dependent methyltransferase
MNEDYKEINRQGWAYLVQRGCDSTQPYGSKQFARAREYLDSRAWIPWDKVRSVLCVAAGGGQQAPLFASLDRRVTVVDLSPNQLQRDREVAERYGFDIECLEGDMLDLSALYGREFDLVYQPVSALYVPDVRALYQEVFRVLKPGGYYWVEHWNPVQMQLADCSTWDGEAYRIAHPQGPGKAIPWSDWDVNGREVPAVCWHYIHPLGHLIGGLCEAGFVILRFAETSDGDLSAEPGTLAHLAAYLPTFSILFAQRVSLA